MDNQPGTIWNGAMLQIKDIVNDIVYKTYFETITPVSVSGTVLIVCVRNEFVKNYLRHNYLDLISNAVESVAKRKYTINIVLKSEADAMQYGADNAGERVIGGSRGPSGALGIHSARDSANPRGSAGGSAATAPAPGVAGSSNAYGHANYGASSGSSMGAANSRQFSTGYGGVVNNVTLLNSRYTFDSFVSYSGNMVAHAASLAVAEQAAKAYNPLFLYGGAGLGKTHLMHAVGNYVISQRPESKVVYVSSEKFTNEFINSIRDDRMNEFRDRYRNVDLLLLDDVQFFGRKERAQEELHYTFNELYEANKKIILSSDKKPSEIPVLEERLATRFEWGLMADIQPPDYETRVAILRKKAQIQEIDVPDEIMNYIAELIPQNIRKLEGALNKVVAYSSVTGYNMDLALAEEALREIINTEAGREITSGLVIDMVARYFSLNDDEFIKSKKRVKEIVFPRQIAMYLCRELVGLSLPNIGNLFGGRDHSTVLHAINKLKGEMLVNGEVKRIIDDLTADIRGDN